MMLVCCATCSYHHFHPQAPLQHRRINSVTLATAEKRTVHVADEERFRRSTASHASPVYVGFFASIVFGFLIFCWWKTHWILQPAKSPESSEYRVIDSSRHKVSLHATRISASSIPVQPPSSADLGYLEPLIDKEWSSAEQVMEQRARALFNHWFEDHARKLIELPEGIPGTGITTAKEAGSLQAYLDCFSSNGEWVYGPDGQHLNGSSLPVHKHNPILASCDKAYYKHLSAEPPISKSKEEWAVRPSLKWHWRASSACQKLIGPDWMHQERSSLVRPLVSRKSLCTYLRHKNILLVGDSPTHYLLHDLLLDWTSTRPLTCYGDLYCKEHAICPDELVEEVDPSQQWDSDVRVFDSLQDPPGRSPGIDRQKHWSSSPNSASQTRGTVLRYRRADSMFMNSSPSHLRHQPGFVHPHTGVRDINMYSVADGRRSDVTILYKAPVAYPRPSKSGSEINQRMLKLARTFGDLNQPLIDRLTKLIELATIATTEVWLPEVLESLRALKAPPASPDGLLIYRSGWNMHESCGQKPSIIPGFFSPNKSTIVSENGAILSAPSLGRILFPSVADTANSSALADASTVYYNLQNIMQNAVMRKVIAPRLGIPFINLAESASVWMSGFVGDARALMDGTSSSLQAPLRAPAARQQPKDCLRMCLPSPGLLLETFFLGSLDQIFEWGWGGSDRARTWVGDQFQPVRDRARGTTNKAK